MKKCLITSTLIFIMVLVFVAAFTNITYADDNFYKKGDQAKEIIEIQKALKALKLFDEATTGYFGEVIQRH